MSAASLSSSHFLGGLRIAQSPRSAAASPPSPSLIRSAVASAAAAERRHATVAVSSPAFSTSLYEVLGVSRVASAQEIKAAYRRRARECHPDVIATGCKGASADEFMRVHAAYATLSEPRRREDYDHELAAAAAAAVFHHSAPALSSSPWVPAYARCTSFPGHGRRTWETDQCW